MLVHGEGTYLFLYKQKIQKYTYCIIYYCLLIHLNFLCILLFLYEDILTCKNGCLTADH